MKMYTVRWGIWLVLVGLLSLVVEARAGYSKSDVLQADPLEHLSFPGAVASDGTYLYVEHPSEDMISKVDLATGKVVGTIANEDDPDTEELITPDDLWRDPITGDLYVTEVLVNGVVRVSPDGKTRTRILFGFGDGSQAVNGVEVDAITGTYDWGDKLRLFISTFSLDPKTKTGIWEISPDLSFAPQLVYGAVGGVDVYGQGLHGPDALAINPMWAEGDAKELFVSELSGGRVWAIDIDTHEARLVYDPPGVTAETVVSAAFKFDSAGKIVYADFQSGKILRLDPNGPAIQTPEIIVASGPPGIHNVGVDNEKKKIFTSNIINGQITIMDEDGSNQTSIGGNSLNLPNGILPLPGGRLAVADLGAVAIVDPEGKSLTRPWNFLVQNLDLTAGIGMTADCSGYATAFSRGTLQYLGSFCEKLGVRSSDILPAHSFAFPADIVGGDGELWVSDLMGFVWHVILPKLPVSAPAISVPLPTSFAGPTGLAMSPDSKLYVAESMAGQVRIVDPVTGATLGLITGLAEPEGLAFDLDGSLLVVEAGSGTLTRFKPDGTRELGPVATGLKTHKRGVSVIPQFNFFADVAVDGERNIFITSPEDGSLTRLEPEPGP